MLLWPIQSEFTYNLPYFFLGVGYNYNQEHVIRPGDRPEINWSYGYYQLIQCVKGKGKIIIGDRTETLHKGQFLFLVPNEPHEYYSQTDEWIVNWIILSGASLEYFAKNILNVHHCEIYSLSAPQIISDKIEMLYNTFLSSNPSKDMYGSTLIYEILMDLYQFSFKNQTDSLSEKTNKLAPVFDYIDHNYQHPISLSDLAPLIDITTQHLCTSFKALTSYTVFEYIIMYRIQKSKELLINNRQMQIKEVAFSCGFNDVSYFCSLFKKYEFVTPKQFREMH